MCKKLIIYIALCGLAAFTFGGVDYYSVIQPIFDARCISCHSGSDAEEDLSLTSYDNVMNGGDSGDVIIPYDHANSLLWQYINSGFMPPGTNDLTDSQVNLIAEWIDEGALEQPGGCTDPEAYNCEDSMAGEYINEIGPIVYDYSCDGNPDHAGTLDCNAGEICEGYYDSEAFADDGSCRYPQAPNGDEIAFNVLETGINVDWSAFTPPPIAILESYHVQRCLGDNCQWLSGFNPNLDDPNTSTSAFDNNEYELDVEIKYAIGVKYSNNPYWGWAIGASYITPPCPALGNLNGDTDSNGNDSFNVLDIVSLANCVLAGNCPELRFACTADLNGDGDYNVLDIVTLANCVLAQNCSNRVDDASHSRLIMQDNVVSIEADGFIGGVQMTLQHGDNFSIKMTDWALFADYLTSDNETRLLVITPETDELFSYNGDFEIEEIIVANTQYEVPVELPEGNALSNIFGSSTRGIITEYSLSAAFPNPFNPITMITLSVPTSGHVSVQVYNLSGQVVATLANGHMNLNTYNALSWDATDAVSGMYFIKAQADGFTATQKLMLVK